MRRRLRIGRKLNIWLTRIEQNAAIRKKPNMGDRWKSQRLWFARLITREYTNNRQIRTSVAIVTWGGIRLYPTREPAKKAIKKIVYMRNNATEYSSQALPNGDEILEKLNIIPARLLSYLRISTSKGYSLNFCVFLRKPQIEFTDFENRP